MQQIASLLSPLEVSEKVIEYEYQALGLEMQDFFGKDYSKRIWPLFYKYPVPKVREAWLRFKKQPVLSFNYFFGILRRM